MRRGLLWFLTGAVSSLAALCIAGLVFLQTGAHGFSARSEPSLLESFAAVQARGIAMPAEAKSRSNPVTPSKPVLDDAMAHWADHCAICHANDGSGQVDMGRQMYPHAPDMRKENTQKLTDGELFYIIENGIRLSGMPAWGGSAAGEKDSWKLVHFIRHLPKLSETEIREMEKLNPKGSEDKQQEEAEEQFLNGQVPKQEPRHHTH